MQGRITKRAVDALQPPTKGERVLWDDEIRGFGLRMQRGGSKAYVLHYRAGHGRGAPLRKLTIGRHGSPWTPETARREAKRLLGLVASGKDPAASKAADARAPTVAGLTARFLAEHVEAKRKPRTAAEYRRLLDKIIVPALGKRKVQNVIRADIAKLHHELRATPYEANRVLAVLGKMFALAEAWGRREPAAGNPARGIEKYPERKREQMLSAEELGRLGEALRVHGSAGGSPYVVAAIRLLVFTGARLSEILGLQWSWIDFERAEARLPDSKTGAKTLHLPPPAMAVLANLPRLDGNPHVIVGMRRGAPLVNLEKPWRAIRIAAGLDGLRLHDLRHAFASIAASSGLGLPIIGKMLGHTQPATTARYAHLASDPVKAAAATVADRIESAMAGAPPAGEVVRLRPSA
jgi:integrase